MSWSACSVRRRCNSCKTKSKERRPRRWRRTRCQQVHQLPLSIRGVRHLLARGVGHRLKQPALTPRGRWRHLPGPVSLLAAGGRPPHRPVGARRRPGLTRHPDRQLMPPRLAKAHQRWAPQRGHPRPRVGPAANLPQDPTSFHPPRRTRQALLGRVSRSPMRDPFRPVQCSPRN